MGSRSIQNAVLLLDKPEGITSYDLIREVKRLSGLKKIGHSGTLDKFASGLLVICTGMATKLARFFLADDKAYTGVVKLGVTTDTNDAEGRIIRELPADGVTEADLIREAAGYTGEISQVPPRYSALKINGKRASDLARAGEEVDMKVRRVTVHELRVRDFDPGENTVTLDVVCSKGTYIRALARDIGERLGTGALLVNLRRTRSGLFSVEDAVDIKGLGEYISGSRGNTGFLVKPLEALDHFGSITVRDEAVPRIMDGAFFSREDVIEVSGTESKLSTVIDKGKNLIAIAEVDFDNWNVRYTNVFRRGNSENNRQ